MEEIMAPGNATIRKILCAAAMGVASITLEPALAAEDNADAKVHKVLLERTEKFCKAVLPAWFASERGIHDLDVRQLVADCYMGYARLSILGLATEFSLDDIALSEVPAALLRKETGMNLDIYRPLAGHKLRVRKEVAKK
jgi:hypothetical protein